MACGSFGTESGTPAPVDAGTSSDAPTPPCDLAKTDSDPDHCGSCGHSCLGGGCSAGKCQPILIGADPAQAIFSVAVSDRHVVWMTTTAANGNGAGSLAICPKEGCGAAGPKVLAQRNAGNVAADGANIYASFPYQSPHVATVAPIGVSEISTLAKYRVPLWLIARDGALFVNAFYGSDAGAHSRTIIRYTEQEGPREIGTYVSPPNEVHNTGPTAVTKDRVFLGAYNTGVILSCALSACSSWDTFRKNDDAYVVSIATNDERLFWVGINAKLSSCSAKQSPCTELSEDLSPADVGAGIAHVAYGRGLLVVGTDRGELYACDPMDCRRTRRLVVQEPALEKRFILDGNNIVVDADAIYYVARDVGGDGGGGVSRLMKVAR